MKIFIACYTERMWDNYSETEDGNIKFIHWKHNGLITGQNLWCNLIFVDCMDVRV